MSFATIHTSGTGSEKLTVDSWHNGLAYNVQFGEAGSTMRNVFIQGEDAETLRGNVDDWEGREPETSCREIWLESVSHYL